MTSFLSSCFRFEGSFREQWSQSRERAIRMEGLQGVPVRKSLPWETSKVYPCGMLCLGERGKVYPRGSFESTANCQRAFGVLKTEFTDTQISAHLTMIETCARSYALGAVQSQVCDDERLHTVAFHSRKLEPAQINYGVHDKEMLA